jgi:hypothetical protein
MSLTLLNYLLPRAFSILTPLSSYISDVGARPHLKPFFIALASLMASTFLPTLTLHLFRRRTLPVSSIASSSVNPPLADPSPAPNTAISSRPLLLLILATLSILLNLSGAACLISLTILDDLHHKRIHYLLLSAALPSYFASAVLCCVHDGLELRKTRRGLLRLLDEVDEEKMGAWRLRRPLGRWWWSSSSGTDGAGSGVINGAALCLRIALLSVEFLLLTLFSAFCWANVLWDVAGVIEWCVAGVFGMYIGSFIWDLWSVSR